MRIIMILLLLTFSIAVKAQPVKLPQWFTRAFEQHKLNKRYEVILTLKPAYLISDFDGDKLKDVAVWVADKKTGKRGILTISQLTKAFNITGAGKQVGTVKGFEDTNLDWIEGWKVYTHRIAYETTFDNSGNIEGSAPRRLTHNSIMIYAVQDDSPLYGGLISKKGNKWIWIHQGE